jgi:hypothetical protein
MLRLEGRLGWAWLLVIKNCVSKNSPTEQTCPNYKHKIFVNATLQSVCHENHLFAIRSVKLTMRKC